MVTTVNNVALQRDQVGDPLLEGTVALYFSTLQVIGGQRVRGQVLDIADTTRVTNFHGARRLFRVRPNSPVKVGNLLQTITGQVFLCGQHGDGYFKGMIYRHFKLFEMTHQGVWTRRVEVVDPITGLQTQEQSNQTLGTIHYALEEHGTLSDDIRIPESKFTIITSAALQPSDNVDQYIVRRADLQLGVTIAEVV